MSVGADRPRDWIELRNQLDRIVGRPRRSPPLPLGNRADPDEELLFILLTLLTRSQPAIESVLTALLDRFGRPPWAALAGARRDRLARMLGPVGLVNRRATQLRELGRVISSDLAGSVGNLADLDDDSLLLALEALPGVGRKSARCVAAYAFGRNMLAVDVHVLRVLKRIGFAGIDDAWLAVDERVNSEVPPRIRYALHVQLVAFGRTVCKTRAPDCSECGFTRWCPSSGVAEESRAAYVVERRRI